MADDSGEFLDLMRRVRAGDEAAARELYQRYGRHILRVVRRRLRQPLRSRFDSTDFTQSVWKAFFAATQHYTFDTPQALLRYLEKVASRKVAGAYRRGTQTAKDPLYRQLPLDTRSPDGDGPSPNHLASADPTPSQEAVANERWARLLDGQSPAAQAMLTLRRQGFTIDEIANLTGVASKTVQRLLRHLEDRPDA
jgi:RNA polymerase sigma-70 factor (ECF subfamily)